MYYLLFTIGMATLCDAAPVPATNVFNAAAVCTSKHKYFDQSLSPFAYNIIVRGFGRHDEYPKLQ